ncbi:MAG: zinc ribbon domain-containing protein [SAR324 cluster bacterium]|nr:zinc ribbon domain-containing protein [SAR324 cluster bacterium]
MPIYEYGCAECGYEFEEMQKFRDPPLQDCPQCEQPAAQRKVSISAFHLKGGGWYKDGYGNNKPESSGSDEKSEKSGGSEAKPETPKSEKSGSGKSEGKSEKSGSTSSKSEGSASKPAASKPPAKSAA